MTDTADTLLDGASAARRAVALLRAEGLMPIAISIAASHCPVIEVAAGTKTSTAIEREKAVYYKFSHLCRTGQFLDRPHGCVVEWTERGRA